MKTTKMLLTVVLAWGLAAELTRADFAFGTPTNLGPMVNSSYGDSGPNVSADGLSLFFHSSRPGGSGAADIWVTTRTTTGDPWSTPVNLGPTVNSSGAEWGPSVSADGLSLYFHSNGRGKSSADFLWLSTRLTTDDPWGTSVHLGQSVSSPAFQPAISADGLSLFFSSTRAGGSGEGDLWVATRATTSDPWSAPVNLGSMVNTSFFDWAPAISADGLSLFFASGRSGGLGDDDLWVTMRARKEDDWGAPVNLGPAINSSARDGHPSISADGSTLYFSSRRPGGVGDIDIWQVSISPVVDFNGDGNVTIKDLVRLIESWGQDDPSVDMAPGPIFGDGVVDVKDLEVLMSYWGQEMDDPTLTAYWKLDETEGDIAYDSAGTHDAFTTGDPLWQPDGGRVGGALLFDGSDDAVIADPVLRPIEGPFSVFAWIKGGLPGQVVISQEGAAHWLMADPVNGTLMTALAGSQRGAGVLTSETVITDGDWHRIGLVWDGAYRSLYVDDELVAFDASVQVGLKSSGTGLNMGAGKDLSLGTFWSGLIDDVRIHSRVVVP